MPGRFARAVREKREGLGMNQKEFADLCGITAGTLGKIEKGDMGMRADLLFLLITAGECNKYTMFVAWLKDMYERG